MPKTKRKIKKEVDGSLCAASHVTEADIEAYLESMNRELALRNQKIRSELKAFEMNLNIQLKEMSLKFSYPEKTMAELKAMDKDEGTLYEPTTLLRNLTNLMPNTTVSSGSKDDSALIMMATSTVKKQRKPRLSKSLTRITISKTARMATATPSNCTLTPCTVGMITPKMKPNAPQVLLRRPKQGEVAVSMQGSPLMVGGVTSDDKANVNIPLQDGRVLSIQPQRGLRTSEIPDLDPETKQHIQALRDNLNKICALTANR